MRIWVTKMTVTICDFQNQSRSRGQCHMPLFSHFKSNLRAQTSLALIKSETSNDPSSPNLMHLEHPKNFEIFGAHKEQSPVCIVEHGEEMGSGLQTSLLISSKCALCPDEHSFLLQTPWRSSKQSFAKTLVKSLMPRDACLCP